MSQVKNIINNTFASIAAIYSTPLMNHGTTIETHQRMAFYHAEAAKLLTDPVLKAITYKNAGEAKWNEALLLNDEADREKKKHALSQTAFCYAKAAALFIDPTQKAQAYSYAGVAKGNEAQLWDEATDCEQKMNAWSLVTIGYL